MFQLAAAYERFMGRWSRQLAPLLVRYAGVVDGEALLDVGSGTGALTTALATAAPLSRIVGIDRSEPYVRDARSRTSAARVRFCVGDAQHIGAADATFDRTLSMLLLNFVPDPARALTEMIRVTRPGGVVAAAVWDYGAGMEMLRVFWSEAVALDKTAERSDECHMPLCRPRELAALWSQQRLQDVEEQALTIDTPFASFDDYWSPFLEQQGPAGAYVASLSGPARAILREGVRRRVLENRREGPIALRARAWAVRGSVPTRPSTRVATPR